MMRARGRPVAIARTRGLLVLACTAPCLLPAALRAQQVTTAVVPQTIHVGDVFHAAVRVELPGRAEVVFPDTLALASEDIEAAGRARITIDTLAGGRAVTAAYPLTAWRSGVEIELPDVAFAVRDGAAERVLTASFPSFTLQSVLPADTSGIEPKPAKDVIGASRIWWPWIVGALLVLLIAAAIFYALRRRRARARPAVAPVAPAISPRAAALARLQQAREQQLVERGEVRVFYGEVTGAVRGYLESVDPVLGADLTTSEIARHVRGRGAPAALLALLQLLGRADLVKFARAHAAAADAYADWDAARAWVESYDGWVPSEEAKQGRAA